MRKLYADALLSQGACNLSGIVHSLSRALPAIWDDVRAKGGGTDEVNRHPICRLYAEQIGHLSGMGSGNSDTYSVAYDACIAASEAAPEPEATIEPAEAAVEVLV